jgi:hypothetical protein
MLFDKNYIFEYSEIHAVKVFSDNMVIAQTDQKIPKKVIFFQPTFKKYIKN